MTSNEDLYKREEDRKWRESVETRLVSLTSAQKTTDDDLDKHDGRIDDLESLIEGNPTDKDDTGLKGDLSDAWRQLNKLNAIMAPDNLGHGGWENRLKAIEDELGIRRKGRLSRKAFVAAVGLALASSTGFIISNWDKVDSMATWVQKKFSPASSKAITRASRAGGPKKRVVRVRVVPPPPAEKPADGPPAGGEQ